MQEGDLGFSPSAEVSDNRGHRFVLRIYGYYEFSRVGDPAPRSDRLVSRKKAATVSDARGWGLGDRFAFDRHGSPVLVGRQAVIGGLNSLPYRQRREAERDLVDKRGDYAEGRVPEYWIVNPQTETITVLRLPHGCL